MPSMLQVARGVGRRVDHLGQELLAAGVAVQHRVLAAFLEVQHELQATRASPGQCGVRRVAAVAVAGRGGSRIGCGGGAVACRGHPGRSSGSVPGRPAAAPAAGCVRRFRRCSTVSRTAASTSRRSNASTIATCSSDRLVGRVRRLVHQRDQRRARQQVRQQLRQHLVAVHPRKHEVEIGQQAGAAGHVGARDGRLFVAQVARAARRSARR